MTATRAATRRRTSPNRPRVCDGKRPHSKEVCWVERYQFACAGYKSPEQKEWQNLGNKRTSSLAVDPVVKEDTASGKAGGGEGVLFQGPLMYNRFLGPQVPSFLRNNYKFSSTMSMVTIF